jgi:hypothetical protein
MSDSFTGIEDDIACGSGEVVIGGDKGGGAGAAKKKDPDAGLVTRTGAIDLPGPGSHTSPSATMHSRCILLRSLSSVCLFHKHVYLYYSGSG